MTVFTCADDFSSMCKKDKGRLYKTAGNVTISRPAA